MSHLKSQVTNLLDEVKQAFELLEISKKTDELEGLDQQMANPEVWQDNLKAQKLAKKQSALKNLVEPWQELKNELEELISFSELGDDSLDEDIKNRLSGAEEKFKQLKKHLKLNSKFDNYDAIMTIQSGAGGTDAQDWAQMLQRMYARFCEKNDYKFEIIEQSDGEEAGIKSATIQISGSFTYGHFKSEHGVHRLVRQSPFNSAASRETSFALIEIVPLIDEPEEIKLDEQDLKIDTYRASGHGGQSVNTTDSAVRVTHIPTNIVVSIQNEKSQIQNREVALKILRSKLAQLAHEQHQEEVAKLKGPNQEAAWGNQIRNYVLHPYKLVKDTRTDYETSDVEAVLDGKIEDFIDAYLEKNIGEQ